MPSTISDLLSFVFLFFGDFCFQLFSLIITISFLLLSFFNTNHIELSGIFALSCTFEVFISVISDFVLLELLQKIFFFLLHFLCKLMLTFIKFFSQSLLYLFLVLLKSLFKLGVALSRLLVNLFGYLPLKYLSKHTGKLSYAFIEEW